jgi:hypothetical protein
MDFDTFLEFFYARLRRFPEMIAKGGLGPTVGPEAAGAWKYFLSRAEAAHVFLLGEEEKMLEVGRELAQGAQKSMAAGRLPMPFDNLLLVWRHREHGWMAEMIDRPEAQPHLESGKEFFAYGLFREDLLRENMIEPPLGALLDYRQPAPDGSPYTVSLAEIGAFGVPRAAEIGREINERINLVAEALTWSAAICHPYVYLVDSRPLLTPRDERQANKNGRVPDRKRPRYIVLDLPGFYALRESVTGGGTHASPIPHQRRGHLRRLGERCAKARAEGREYVFIRTTIVGDTEFQDASCRYKVILNAVVPSPVNEPRT